MLLWVYTNTGWVSFHSEEFCLHSIEELVLPVGSDSSWI